jgi:molybdopterin/thiamine biosynthesis adenylyltransferase
LAKRDKKILIVGAGGLGVPAAMALARENCASITIIDPERVELSNLARQIVFQVADIGAAKAQACAAQLRAVYPKVEVQALRVAFDHRNGADLIGAHDFTIDGTDDPEVKFLINDLSLRTGRRFAYGGVLGMRGQAMTVVPGQSACLRCLFEQPPLEADVASCREAGIIGPVAGLIAEIQAAEAARYLRGEAPRLAGRMVTYDANRLQLRSIEVRRRADCVCAEYYGTEIIAGADAR